MSPDAELTDEDVATVKRNQYFCAVQVGLDKNYGPMEAIFEAPHVRGARETEALIP